MLVWFQKNRHTCFLLWLFSILVSFDFLSVMKVKSSCNNLSGFMQADSFTTGVSCITCRHPTKYALSAGILQHASRQAFFHALSFFWVDGFG